MWPALSLAGYPDKVVGAIAIVLGDMLICDHEASHWQAATFLRGRPLLRRVRDTP
jgi:hypothetical protein